jgi:putative membrane protein
MEEVKAKALKRILILCVDRDGDLSVKAEVRTPVIGRSENLNAAVTLALRDPEEPDANAMFEAVRTFDRLKAENSPDEAFEIATISGSDIGWVDADRKIVQELSSLLTGFAATEVILVTDGYSDEAVLPLVESRVPVSSVRRIVVKHSESIEESVALFMRYLKMLVENSRYSRVVLGLPGLLLLGLAIFTVFNVLYLYWMFLLFMVSAFMLFKGFGVDRTLKNTYKWMKEYSPPPLRVQISSFAAVAGVLSIVIGAYLGWSNAATRLTMIPAEIGGWLILMPQLIGNFIKGAMDLIVVGICVALLGRAIRWYLERDPRLLRTSALVVSMAWSRQILDGASDVLVKPELGYEKLITYIMVGILIGVASVLVIVAINRSGTSFFATSEEQVEHVEN